MEVFHRVYWSHHSALRLSGTPATSEQRVNTLDFSVTFPQHLSFLRAGYTWADFPQQHLLAIWLCPYVFCSLWDTTLQMKISPKSKRLKKIEWILTHPFLKLTVLFFWDAVIGTSLQACPCPLMKPITVLLFIRPHFKPDICKHSQALFGRISSEVFSLWSSWLL